MKAPSLSTIVLIAVALVAVAYVKRGWEQDALLRAKNKVLIATNDSLRHRGDSLARTFKVDTIRLTRWQTRYDTLYADRHITDTLWVRQFILTADSTIKSCRAALTTCEAIQVVLRSEVANAEARLGISEKRRKGFRFLGIPLGCVGGLSGNQRGVGVGAACGFSILK